MCRLNSARAELHRPCAQCGERRIAFLEFAHRDRALKRRAVSDYTGLHLSLIHI
jgi:hypothetical protein